MAAEHLDVSVPLLLDPMKVAYVLLGKIQKDSPALAEEIKTERRRYRALCKNSLEIRRTARLMVDGRQKKLIFKSHPKPTYAQTGELPDFYNRFKRSGFTTRLLESRRVTRAKDF